jgi:hypothetical protein
VVAARLYNITVGTGPVPFLWFRVAKAGTRSTFNALRAWNPDFEIENGFRMRVPPQAWPDHLRFTFVRDPYARFVSAWRDKIVRGRPGSGIREPALLETLSDFDRFVDWVLAQDPERINVHFRPQTMLVPDNVDFIGRVESFDADLRHLFGRLGLGDLPEVPHQNRSTWGKRPDPVLTPDRLEGFNRYFGDDFRRFGYAVRK